MRYVYPAIIYKKKNDKFHCVYVPDIDSATQGENITECLEMAKDLIRIEIIDKGDSITRPFTIKNKNFYGFTDEDIEEKILVDIDTDDFELQ